MKPQIRLALLSIGLFCVASVGLGCIANPRLPRFPRPLPTGVTLRDAAQITGTVRVAGYTFSYPKEIPDGLNGPVTLLGWFPRNNDEVVILSLDRSQVLAVNVTTGAVRPVSERTESPLDPSFIHLLTQGRAAFVVLVNDKGQLAPRLTGGSSVPLAPTLTVTRSLNLVTLPQHEAVLFFARAGTQLPYPPDQPTVASATLASLHKAMQTMQIGEQLTQTRQAVPPPQWFYSATTPVGDWIALANTRYLQLVNIATAEQRTINLHHLPDFCSDCVPYAHVMQWSPDGQKLAMLVPDQPPVFSTTALAIYDVQSQTLSQLPRMPNRYVGNFAWAPDSLHLALTLHIGTQRGVGVHQLAVFNSQTRHLEELAFPGLQILGGHIGYSMTWSPDGRALVLAFWNGVPSVNNQLYLIQVRPKE